MQNKTEKLSAPSAEVTKVALKVFFRICQAWQLNDEEEIGLLGSNSGVSRNGENDALSLETLERISYVLGIYKALRTLFPEESQANAWPRKPNQHFEGKSALEVMLDGRLHEVRGYLDSLI